MTQEIVDLLLIFIVSILTWRIILLERDRKYVNQLATEETKRKVLHSQLLSDLTDEDKIMADMERGADIIEARQANRLTVPRTDAGPPARVFRPKMRGKRQSSWNPPRP